MPKKIQARSSKPAVKTAARNTNKPALKKPVAKASQISAKPSAKKALASKTSAKHPPATAVGKKTSVKQSSGSPAATAAPDRKAGLIEGSKAPAFQLMRDGGESVSLSDYSGRKLVMFFYPRADTPGCTKEAIDFTRLSGAFLEAGTAVLGVSGDPSKAQEAFRDKHALSIPLLSDEKLGMLKDYGVWGEKSMYGKTFQGILRTTVLIGSDGKVAKIWRNVKVDGHADEVLVAAQAL